MMSEDKKLTTLKINSSPLIGIIFGVLSMCMLGLTTLGIYLNIKLEQQSGTITLLQTELAAAQKTIGSLQKTVSADEKMKPVAFENQLISSLRTELAAVQKMIVPLQEYVSAHQGIPSVVNKNSNEYHPVNSQVQSIGIQLGMLEKKIGTFSVSALQLSNQIKKMSVGFLNQQLINKKTADFEQVMSQKIAKLERQIAFLIQDFDALKSAVHTRWKLDSQ